MAERGRYGILFHSRSAASICGAPLAVANLTSIEFGLIAELNSEVARGYEEVADDRAQLAETRRTARQLGARLRNRARLFQLEAKRVGAESTVALELPDRYYVGPERRMRERRKGQHRAPAAESADRSSVGYDRRSKPDRRG